MITNEENWIDLSGLPRFEGVTKHKNINWKASPGCEVEFCYNGINGIAKILSINVKTRKLRVYIDGWTIDDGEDINIQYFQNCWLHKLHNKIAILAPELMIYLEDIFDAYRYPVYYNGNLNMKCPKCGSKKICKMGNVIKNGFCCDQCGDGVSYPNKFMFNILTQLKVDFINEVSRAVPGFEWCENYRYDFYFTHNQKRYFVEMDGHFHDYNREKNNDEIKDELAKRHNVHLIRIDCKYHKLPFEYIKRNILNSELTKFFNFDNVDWQKCDEYASSSLLPKICDMWENQNMSMGDIMKETHFSKTTVRTYLLRGVALGLCPSYNKKESRLRYGERATKAVACYYQGELKHVFVNDRAVEDFSLTKCVGKFAHSGVRRACLGDGEYMGLLFKHISYFEYQRLCSTINNNVDEVIHLFNSAFINQMVVAIKNNTITHLFYSMKQLIDSSKDIFGVKMNSTNVYRVINGDMPSYRGWVFARITQEQYKMIEKNKNYVVVKGGDIS